jgi:hypothetical protein
MGAPLDATADLSALCERLHDATVEIVGDLRVYRPDGRVEDIPDRRTGSGFFLDTGQVVTAWHVVSRLSRIDVCGPDRCQPVQALQVWPEADIALLTGTFDAPHALRSAATPAIGAPLVVAGYPGDLGFTCGPGHVIARPDAPTRFVMFDGETVAEGASGGPVALLTRRARKTGAFAAVTGALVVGTGRLNRAAEITELPPSVAWTPANAREAAPWVERRTVKLTFAAGGARYEDVKLPPWVDFELVRTDGDLCVGLFEARVETLAEQLSPTPIATRCDGQPIRATTTDATSWRIGVWSPHGGTGTVELRRR